MDEPNNFIKSSVNWCQLGIGATALLAGTLVYLIDRPSDQAYFIHANNFYLSLHNTFPDKFGVLGNNLPAFIHVFSFIMITAGPKVCQKRLPHHLCRLVNH